MGESTTYGSSKGTAMAKPKVQFEIINHGVDHSQYFQGCGAAFTDYDYCMTGMGENAAEAYEDACESVAQVHSETARWLPVRPRGIRKTDRVPADAREDTESEIYYYVSIRYCALEDVESTNA